MKVKDKFLKARKKYSDSKKWAIFLILTIFLLNIGYAASKASLEISGSASAVKIPDLFIEEVKIIDINGCSQNELPITNGPTLDTNINFPSNEYSYITYQVTIANGTDSIQKYTGETYNSDTSTKNVINYELTDGLSSGEYLFPGNSATYTLTYKYRNGASTGNYDLKMNFNFEDSGKFSALSYTNSVDLTNKTKEAVKIKVMNNGDSAINYNLNIDNTKFELTDINGNSLSSLSIKAHTEEEITVYLSKKSDVTYYKTEYETNFSLSYNDITLDFGKIKIKTNTTSGYVDTTPPQIGAVSVDIVYEVGSIDVTWSNLDNKNESPVTNYVVLLYNDSGTLVTTGNTGNSDTTYRFKNQAQGNYYAVVYGIDEAENSGETYVSSSSTSTTNARKSITKEMRWKRTITYNVTNISVAGPNEANLGESFTATLKPDNNYKYNSVPSVTSDGKTFKDYSTNADKYTITINQVTGDLVITATAARTACLAKGTKILLANGKYKNIENIRYDDLLMVYNHENGTFTPEYPIWIEKGNLSSNYQVITFSDGTSLTTIDKHSLFSVDDNRYVDVTDENTFHVGTNILKTVKSKRGYKLKSVSVTNIEKVNKSIDYYNVVSTRYYDIIANDVLTSDGRTGLVNFYEFKENAVWSSRRQEVIKNNTFLNYEDYKFIPYYLFHGLRAQDGAVIIKYNYMTKEEFESVFTDLLLNKEMVLDPITKNKKRYWMVTTSDDKVTSKNKEKYLLKENSYYTLEKPKKTKNFKGWYNTGDGKIYKPGSKVKIYHGTHFVASYNKN